MSPDQARGTRCPRCDALVGRDASWCALCYAEIAPVAPAGARDGALEGGAPPRPPVSPDPSPPATTASDTAPDTDRTVDVDDLLARLAAEVHDGAGRLPALGARLRSPGARLALAAGALAAFVALALAAMTVLGLLV